MAAGGRARRQPALPRSAGHRRCPGDMMIDRVSPACGDAAAQSDTKTGSPVGARQRTLAWAAARLEDGVGCPAGEWPGAGSAAAPGLWGKGWWLSAGC